jgi:uncharacterized surface protein with fasciclin (FAS1) repeats
MTLVRNTLFAAAVAVASIASGPVLADNHGGAKTIVETATASPDFSTLVAAVKAAGLVETLNGEGPFTVFAPTNAAFEKLPEGTVETLLKPENKDQLVAVLTYHVVPGDVMSGQLVEMIKGADGKAMVKTVQGENLTAMVDGDAVKIMDGQGNAATVTGVDMDQSNGVIHVIDTVLLP